MATEGAKPKPKAKMMMTDKAQSERFKATARKLQANDSAEDFEVKFRKLVPPKHAGRKKSLTPP
jgi:hypothetical protein